MRIWTSVWLPKVMDARDWKTVFVLVVSCLAAAGFFYLAIERPFLALRDRREGRRVSSLDGRKRASSPRSNRRRGSSDRARGRRCWLDPCPAKRWERREHSSCRLSRRVLAQERVSSGRRGDCEYCQAIRLPPGLSVIVPLVESGFAFTVQPGAGGHVSCAATWRWGGDDFYDMRADVLDGGDGLAWAVGHRLAAGVDAGAIVAGGDRLGPRRAGTRPVPAAGFHPLPGRGK